MEPSPLPSSVAETSLATVRAAIESSKTVPSTLPSVDPTTSPDNEEEEAVEAEPQTLEAGLADPRITVFDSATAFNVRHPLYARWQLWFDSASRQDKAKSWDDALVKVISFDSVEEFWGLYNNIVPPSLIHPNSNYYLFKEGVKPAWEDPANAKGGKWSVQLPRGKYSDAIDSYWLYTMLAAIGETFETPFTPSTPSASSAAPSDPSPLPPTFSDQVTGVIVSSRKAFYRLNIWTRSSSAPDKAKLENIGRHFKYGVLAFDEGVKISERDKVSSDVEFVSHSASTAKYGAKGAKWTV